MRRKSDYVATILGAEDYVRPYRSVDGYILGERAYPNVFVTFYCDIMFCYKSTVVVSTLALSSLFMSSNIGNQWPLVLRRCSAAARLLRYGFESHQCHGCLSVVCCQVEVSATS